MAIIRRWDPFKDLIDIQDRMNRLFEESMRRFRFSDFELPATGFTPAVDIYETDESIVVKAEIPGVEKGDVKIEVKDNELLLKGEKRVEKDVKDENYHRIERVYGSFQRSFSLPQNVDKDKIKASFKNGVLEIKLPKKEEAKPKEIKIE